MDTKNIFFQEQPVVESDGRWYEKDNGEDEIVE